MTSPLRIFVPHCSDLLTDYLPHGDGLIAHGFITNLARRGHQLHVAAQRVELREPLLANITLYQSPLRTTGRILSRLEYMFRVRRLLHGLSKSMRFDLIHQLNPVFSGMSLSLLGSGLPLVLGTYVARWPEDPDSLVSSKTWTGRALALGRNVVASVQQRQADVLLLTTPAAENRLPFPNDVRDRIQVLPHGLDTQLFRPEAGWDSDERLLADQRNPSVLFFANVVERKGIFTLIEAFPAIVQSVPNVMLRIAGDGPALPEVKRRVAALRCASQVAFLGRQERSAAPALYRNSSVYCLPSHGEPYATTVLEAMSCGKPVVVTDAGGLAHMVDDRGGRKVPVGDTASLAAALVKLLRDPSQRRAMGRYNRELVERTMTWEHVTRRLEEIYREMLHQAGMERQSEPHRKDVLLLDRASDASVQERV